MRFFLRSCIFAAWIACAAPTFADPRPTVDLTWSGPEECPSGDEVLSSAGRLLSKFDSTEPPLVAHGNVVTEPGGLRLELDTWPGDRLYRRTIHAPSCSQLADAAALILALLIDPGLRNDPTIPADVLPPRQPPRRPP